MNEHSEMSDEIRERLNKLESEPIFKPFSCVNIILALFALFVSAFLFLIIFVLWTFPKASDYNEHHLKRFMRMNAILNQNIDELGHSLDEIDVRLHEIERKSLEQNTHQP